MSAPHFDTSESVAMMLQSESKHKARHFLIERVKVVVDWGYTVVWPILGLLATAVLLLEAQLFSTD